MLHQLNRAESCGERGSRTTHPDRTRTNVLFWTPIYRRLRHCQWSASHFYSWSVIGIHLLPLHHIKRQFSWSTFLHCSLCNRVLHIIRKNTFFPFNWCHQCLTVLISWPGGGEQCHHLLLSPTSVCQCQTLTAPLPLSLPVTSICYSSSFQNWILRLTKTWVDWDKLMQDMDGMGLDRFCRIHQKLQSTVDKHAQYQVLS